MKTQREVIVVTGGSGLIGQAVAKRFSERYEVLCLDKAPPKRRIPNSRYIECDVSSQKSVHHALRQVARVSGRKIASVIHLAAYYSFSGEPSPLYDRITVHGTQILLHELKKFEVEQLVFSSTMLVHSPRPPGHEIDEDSPVDPKWEYPQSKLRAEQIIEREHNTIPVVNLRIAGVYDDTGHSIPIANQIQRIYERQLTSHFYPGEMTRGQAFIHLDDLVESIWLVVQKRHELPNELTLLIGEPETVPYGELQELIGEALYGRHWRTLQIPKKMAKSGAWFQDLVPIGRERFIKPWMIDLADDHYDLDVERAHRILGWSPTRELRRSIPVMIANLKQNPRAWYRENKLEMPPLLWRARRILAGAGAVTATVLYLRRRQKARELQSRGTDVAA